MYIIQFSACPPLGYEKDLLNLPGHPNSQLPVATLIVVSLAIVRIGWLSQGGKVIAESMGKR